MITTETRYDQSVHIDPWRNEIARELNTLMAIARAEGEESKTGEDILSIVQRVAEFEEIRQVE